MVRLYDPLNMAEDWEFELKNTPEFAGERPWVTGEYEILTAAEAKELRKQWNEKIKSQTNGKG